MANLNKVLLIGRLTKDPETRTFANGGKVTYFRFAANNRKKNQTTNQWEDDPMFIDVKVFNRGEFGKQADLAEQSLRKGHQVFLEGHLVLEQWDDKQSGEKRSKHVVVVDNFQFLERREGGPDGSGAGLASGAPSRSFGSSNSGMSGDMGGYDDAEPSGGPTGPASGPPDEDIPF
jgi:single-strand DNA-binding protein